MSQDQYIWNDGLLSMPSLASDWDHTAPHLEGRNQSSDDASFKVAQDYDGTDPAVRRLSQPLVLSGSVWGQSDGVQPTWMAATMTASNTNESTESRWGGAPAHTSPSSGPLSLTSSTSSDGAPVSAVPVPSIGMDLAHLAASSMTLEPTAKPFTPGMANPPSDIGAGAASIRDAMVNAPVFVPKTAAAVGASEFVPKMAETMANAPEFVPKAGAVVKAPEFVPKLGVPAFVPKGGAVIKNKNALQKSVLMSTAKPFVSSAYAQGASNSWEAKAAGAAPYHQPQFSGRHGLMDTLASNAAVDYAASYGEYRGQMQPQQLPLHPPRPRAMDEDMIPVKRGGCIFFVPLSQATPDELRIHIGGSGAGIDPLQILHLPPSECSAKISLELPDEWQQHYDAKSILLTKEIENHEDERYAEVPPGYDSILPLDSTKGTEEASSLGVMSSVFKVKSERDGLFYALRKIRKVTVTNAVAFRVLDSWRNIKPLHPSVVLPKHIFTHNRSLIFVRKYFPGAQTLKQRFMRNSNEAIREERLWGYICQLVSALRSCHAEGLPCRVMHADRILISAHDKLRINDICVMDLLYPSSKSIAEMLQDDLRALGKVIASLASQSEVTSLNMNTHLRSISENFSSEFSNLVNQLLFEDSVSIERVCSSICSRLCIHLQHNFAMIDSFDHVIAKNCMAGRLLKLMMKVGIVGENGEESQVISQVREHLRRQVHGDEANIVDFEEIAEVLNKVLVRSDEVKRIDREFNAYVDLLKCDGE